MIEKVLWSAKKKILYLPHAVQQMSRPDRMITPSEVEEVIHNGEIIEQYEDDPRGESCLMLHFPDGRAIHIVCAPKADYLAIITAYIPDPNQWDKSFKVRR